MKDKVVRDGIYPEERIIADESDVQTGEVPAYGIRMAAEQDVGVAAGQLIERAMREIKALDPDIQQVAQLDPNNPDRVLVGIPNLVGKPGREIVFGHIDTSWEEDRELAHLKRQHDDLRRLAVIAEQLRRELGHEEVDHNESRWLSFQMGLAARKAFERRHAEPDALLGRDHRSRSARNAHKAARVRSKNREKQDREDKPRYQSTVDKLCRDPECTYTSACKKTAGRFRAAENNSRHNLNRVMQLTKNPRQKSSAKPHS